MRSFDYLIIGAGLSGLLQAAIFAKEGARVCVLESHNMPGGYLQTFSRQGFQFDVGFHYIGSTQANRTLGKYFRYLEIEDDIPFCHYPKECFYEVREGSRFFRLPSSFNDFVQELKRSFPEEAVGIEKFGREIVSISSSLPWYDLVAGKSYSPHVTQPSCSLQEWMEENFADPWLKKILGIFSFHLALPPEKTPFWKYCVCLYSLFDRPVWLHGGGDGLVRPLCEKVRQWGGEILLRHKVSRLVAENKKITEAITENGQRFTAPWVVSTIHPKAMLKLLDEDALQPVFRENVLDLEESSGSFLLHIALKKEMASVQPINYLCYTPGQKISPVFYLNSPSLLDKEPDKPRIGVCTFVEAASFLTFRGSKVGRRPAGYQELKQRYTEELLGEVITLFPELEGNISKIYASTPLTNEDYTASEGGSVFGIAHNMEQQGMHRVQPRIRIKNLFLAGQSIHLPGICGVAVNAFYTASAILGHDRLFDKVTHL